MGPGAETKRSSGLLALARSISEHARPGKKVNLYRHIIPVTHRALFTPTVACSTVREIEVAKGRYNETDPKISYRKQVKIYVRIAGAVFNIQCPNAVLVRPVHNILICNNR